MNEATSKKATPLTGTKLARLLYAVEGLIPSVV